MGLFFTHLKLAKISIKENRTRSFLTCLGIAIGVASIILILSLMGSITRLISDQVKSVGEDLIVVRPTSSKELVGGIMDELSSSNSYQSSSLTLADVNIVKNTDKVMAAAPVAVAVSTVVANENKLGSVDIIGTTADFNVIQPSTMRYGTFLTDEMGDNMAVIGSNISLQVFNTQNPLGKFMEIKGQKFIVVGVLSETDDVLNFNNIDFDNSIIIKAQKLKELNETIQIQQISARVKDIESLAEVSENINQQLIESKAGDTNFAVLYGDKITHPASTLFTIVTGILAIVAGISLIVGGIGVMNIMLVSVSERTQEIGIRKAVGASFKNILTQFLFEALILSTLGGFMGMVLGYALAFLISVVTPFAPYISWQIVAITFGTSLLVGVIFGIYPALKAAFRNPIDSLKHYR